MAARVVPSLVVGLIHQAFPFTETQQDSKAAVVAIGIAHAATVAAIAELVEQIAPELITVEGVDYAAFTAGRVSLRHAQQMWQTFGRNHSMINVEGMGNLNPLTLIRRALAKCPDAAPAPGTTELVFVRDADLRESLRNDISSATRAFATGDWKGSTVVAGSVVEALLLWALQQTPLVQVAKAAAALVGNGILDHDPSRNFEDWNLHQYVEVAAHLNLVQPSSAAQTRVAKDFRNLIHPGRAGRLGQVCDRGTALSALAAIEHVARDLGRSKG